MRSASAVTGFEVGQPVVATMGFGSHAELASVPAQSVYAIPDGLATEQAAGVPIEFGTADDCLFEFGHLEAGEAVLVQAGAGGVGLAATPVHGRHGQPALAGDRAAHHLRRGGRVLRPRAAAQACAPDPARRDADGHVQRGARVPLLVVSPWARRHHVSHVVHDHTWILKLIEVAFDLPALTARDANADALLDAFDFGARPRLAVPPPPAAGRNGCSPRVVAAK